MSSNTGTEAPNERAMNAIKNTGMDVHMAMAVFNCAGKLVAVAIIETTASAIKGFYFWLPS